jgi:uncharacterized protein YcbK (DUF882 family)
MMLRLLKDAGIKATVTSGYRSIEKQRELYERARRGQSKLPAAKPGYSTHNYGFAVDVILVGVQQSILGEAARAVGLVWAGPSDPVHVDAFGFPAWNKLLGL